MTLTSKTICPFNFSVGGGAIVSVLFTMNPNLKYFWGGGGGGGGGGSVSEFFHTESKSNFF